MRTFHITPDVKQIVFDRLRENSDIVLINLPKRTPTVRFVDFAHSARTQFREDLEVPDCQETGWRAESVR